MNKCKFNRAWIGLCNKPTKENNDYCEEHSNLICVSCGKPATHECAETMGFVCGAPLCDDCEHTIQSNGCNSQGELPEGYKTHCRKDKQVYTSWFFHKKDNPNSIYTEYGKTLIK